MKLPFFNKRKYIEIKAYTNIKWYVDEVPVVLTKDVQTSHLNTPKLTPEQKKYTGTFNTCYGRLAGLRNSFTLQNWCDHDILANEDKWRYVVPQTTQTFQAIPHKDLVFKPDGMFVTKVIPPWRMECNTDVDFILGSHILNTTGLTIPTGIINSSIPVFNYFYYIPKQKTTYHIPYKMPLIQIFPLSDWPLYVESEYNPTKFEEIQQVVYSQPRFKWIQHNRFRK